jgi:hypothetical protein
MSQKKISIQVESNNTSISEYLSRYPDHEILFSSHTSKYTLNIIDFSFDTTGIIEKLETQLSAISSDHIFLTLLIFDTTIDFEKVSFFEKLFEKTKKNTTPKLLVTKDLYTGIDKQTSFSFDRYIQSAIKNKEIQISKSGSTLFHPLHISELVDGIKKIIFSRRPLQTSYLIGDSHTELQVIHQINQSKNISLDVHNSKPELYQTNVEHYTNKTQIHYNWFPHSDTQYIPSHLDTDQVIDHLTDTSHAPPSKISKYLNQQVTSLRHKFNRSHKSNSKVKRYLLSVIIIFIATYTLEIGVYLHTVQNIVKNTNHSLTEAIMVGQSQDYRQTQKYQNQIRIIKFIEPTIRPVIEIIDPQALAYVSDYHNLLTYISQISSSRRSSQALHNALPASIIDTQDTNLAMDIIKAIQSELSYQYQLLNQLNLVMTSINNYTDGSLTQLQSQVSLQATHLTTSLENIEVLAKLVASDGRIAIAVLDSSFQNPYGGNIIGVLVAPITGQKVGSITSFTSQEIDRMVDGKILASDAFQSITKLEHWTISDLLYTSTPDSLDYLAWYLNQTIGGEMGIDHTIILPANTVSSLLQQEIDSNQGPDKEAQIKALLSAISTSFHGLFQQNNIEKIGASITNGDILLFSSRDLVMQSTIGTPLSHLQQPLECHPNLTSDCHNSYLSLHHTILDQIRDYLPRFSHNLDISAGQSSHTYLLSIRIDTKNFDQDLQATNLISLGLFKDHQVTDIKIEGQSYDPTQLNRSIHQKLIQYYIPVQLKSGSDMHIQIEYQQAIPINTPVYSFHLSVDTQRTQSDQNLQVQYQYPENYQISGLTRQVDVLPGKLQFESDKGSRGFGGIFKNIEY